MDLTCLQNRVRRDKPDPIRPGQAYDVRWDLHADDAALVRREERRHEGRR